ncbi:MAG: HAD family hydrolase [Spirochaetaceae bacterium]|jgi:phosphoglycolate phosphatase|nr:HAD family hydrolase [Spirochaetaceae bacterium]
MKIQGIIFDLDGTLLNTIEDLGDSVNEVRALHGLPPLSPAQYKLKVGLGFKVLIEKSFPEKQLSESEMEIALQKFQECYARNYLKKTAPYPGIPDLLEGLQTMGIKLAVNTNKKQAYTEKLIQHNFPGIDFRDIIGEQPAYPKKPDPAAAISIINKMNLKSSEVIYIGDSKTDIETGRNAGLDTLGVLWGFRDEAELRSAGATHIVSRPDEILELVR